MARPRRYYDPGAKPYARKPVVSTRVAGLPVGAHRNDRRRRAKASFTEQRDAALTQGFPVPPETSLKPEDGATFWIETWEEMYAARAR